VNVTASAGMPSPPTMCIGSQGSASLSASVSNPPSGAPAPIQGPTWSWAVQQVQYSTDGMNWAASPGGDSETITQADSGSSTATLTASFSQAGFW
jgi:hypothetical protein